MSNDSDIDSKISKLYTILGYIVFGLLVIFSLGVILFFTEIVDEKQELDDLVLSFKNTKVYKRIVNNRINVSSFNGPI